MSLSVEEIESVWVSSSQGEGCLEVDTNKSGVYALWLCLGELSETSIQIQTFLKFLRSSYPSLQIQSEPKEEDDEGHLYISL